MGRTSQKKARGEKQGANSITIAALKLVEDAKI